MSRASLLSARPAPAPTRGVPLTSLVDMMTILLVFLLHSFAIDGQIVTPAADVQLPPSRSERPTGPALRVEVTVTTVRVDGRSVAELSSLAGDDPAAVAALRTALAADGEPAAISIHCDRRVGFRYLKRVLRACQEAGGEDLDLLVLREAS